MTKSIAMELAKWNITVNCVSPGFINKYDERLNEEQKKIIINKIPLGMIGSPIDIANCVEFLASEESRYTQVKQFMLTVVWQCYNYI